MRTSMTAVALCLHWHTAQPPRLLPPRRSCYFTFRPLINILHKKLTSTEVMLNLSLLVLYSSFL